MEDSAQDQELPLFPPTATVAVAWIELVKEPIKPFAQTLAGAAR